MLNHVGIIHLIHGRHAAVWVPNAEIFGEQLKLFIGRPRAAFGHNQIAIAFDIAFLRRRWLKLLSNYADGNTSLTIKATGAVGHRLTAPETNPTKRLVQLIRMRAFEFGEYLTLAPPR